MVHTYSKKVTRVIFVWCLQFSINEHFVQNHQNNQGLQLQLSFINFFQHYRYCDKIILSLQFHYMIN